MVVRAARGDLVHRLVDVVAAAVVGSLLASAVDVRAWLSGACRCGF